MVESIHKFFNIGTVQWMSFPQADVLDTVRNIAADPFFDVIELTHFPDEAKRREAKKLLETACIKVSFAAQPIQLDTGLNPNALDEADRAEAERRLKEAADEAEFFGAEAMAFMAGAWDEVNKEAQYRQLVKTTVSLCDYLAAKGMRLELEVFDFDMEKRALIGPAELAARYAAEVRSHRDNFGLLVDLSHLPTTYETAREALPILAPYTTHLHLGNAVVTPGKPAYGDQHPRFAFPCSANGQAELTEFLQIAKNEGLFQPNHKMIMSFEIKPYLDEDPDLVLAGSKRLLNQSWAAVRD